MVKPVKRCRGFWNMCGCSKCKQADRTLEKQMEKAPQLKKSLVMAIASALTSSHLRDDMQQFGTPDEEH